jgi:hypothetical protein
MDVIVGIVSYVALAVGAGASLVSIGLWAWLSLPETVRAALVTPRGRGRRGASSDASTDLWGMAAAPVRPATGSSDRALQHRTMEGHTAR